MKIFFDTSTINLFCKGKYTEYHQQVVSRTNELAYIHKLIDLAEKGQIKIYANRSVENEIRQTNDTILQERLLRELTFLNFSERRAGILPVQLPFTLFPESFEEQYKQLVSIVGKDDARIISDLITAIAPEGNIDVFVTVDNEMIKKIRTLINEIKIMNPGEAFSFLGQQCFSNTPIPGKADERV